MGIIADIAAALALLKTLKAEYADLVAGGNVTPEQQAEIKKLETEVHEGYAPLFEGSQFTLSDGSKSDSQKED